MANVKQMLNKIEAKLRMLEFTRSDTPRIQEKNELKSLERQEKVFSELINSIHEQKVLIQTAKIEKGDNPEDVTQWTLEIEEKIAKYSMNKLWLSYMVMWKSYGRKLGKKMN